MTAAPHLCWLCGVRPQPSPGEFCDECKAMLLEDTNSQQIVSRSAAKRGTMYESKASVAVLETPTDSPAKGPPKHE